MKNTLRLLACSMLLISLSLNTSGQNSLMKAYGVSTYVYGIQEQDIIPIQLGVANLRLPISAKERSSLTIGTYLGAAVAANLDSRYGGSAAFGGNLPVILDYNLGRGATIDAKGRVGFFVGGGLGINGIAAQSADGASSIIAVGPLANLGFRFRLLNVEYTLRGSYILNLGEASNVAGLTILYERSVSRSGGGGRRGGYRFYRNQGNWRNGQNVMY